MRSVSAKIAREFEEQESYEPFWPTVRKEGHEHTQVNTAGSTVIFGILLVTALIIGSAGVPVPVGGGEGDSSSSSSSKLPTHGWRAFLQSQGATKMREEFSAGLSEWRGSGGNDGWSSKNGMIRPGRLRLWTATENLSDYNLEFSGEIERKGMGWAYRAVNLNNYYATKIVIKKPGPLPRAELVRYAVVNGATDSRVSLPLPMVVRSDTVYRVQVNVRRDQFSTLINGQMVDTWSDGRLKKGGIGFFSDPGESATIRWASVSGRDNMLGRVLSYFGLLLPMPVPPLAL